METKFQSVAFIIKKSGMLECLDFRFIDSINIPLRKWAKSKNNYMRRQ